MKYFNIKKYYNVRDHYASKYRGVAHNISNLKYSVPKKIPLVFHNGWKCDIHFLIEELAEEFKKEFTCLRENTEKYISFTILIVKEVIRLIKIDKK